MNKKKLNAVLYDALAHAAQFEGCRVFCNEDEGGATYVVTAAEETATGYDEDNVLLETQNPRQVLKGFISGKLHRKSEQWRKRQSTAA